LKKPLFAAKVAPMNILIVDDELAIRETCSVVAEQRGMRATGVATAKKPGSLGTFRGGHSAHRFETAPKPTACELLKVVHDLHPQSASWVLTQYGTIESAVEVTRMGAVDYVTKPSVSRSFVRGWSAWRVPSSSAGKHLVAGTVADPPRLRRTDRRCP